MAEGGIYQNFFFRKYSSSKDERLTEYEHTGRRLIQNLLDQQNNLITRQATLQKHMMDGSLIVAKLDPLLPAPILRIELTHKESKVVKKFAEEFQCDWYRLDPDNPANPPIKQPLRFTVKDTVIAAPIAERHGNVASWNGKTLFTFDGHQGPSPCYVKANRFGEPGMWFINGTYDFTRPAKRSKLGEVFTEWPTLGPAIDLATESGIDYTGDDNVNTGYEMYIRASVNEKLYKTTFWRNGIEYDTYEATGDYERCVIGATDIIVGNDTWVFFWVGITMPGMFNVKFEEVWRFKLTEGVATAVKLEQHWFDPDHTIYSDERVNMNKWHTSTDGKLAVKTWAINQWVGSVLYSFQGHSVVEIAFDETGEPNITWTSYSSLPEAYFTTPPSTDEEKAEVWAYEAAYQEKFYSYGIYENKTIADAQYLFPCCNEVRIVQDGETTTYKYSLLFGSNRTAAGYKSNVSDYPLGYSNENSSNVMGYYYRNSRLALATGNEYKLDEDYRQVGKWTNEIITDTLFDRNQYVDMPQQEDLYVIWADPSAGLVVFMSVVTDQFIERGKFHYVTGSHFSHYYSNQGDYTVTIQLKCMFKDKIVDVGIPLEHTVPWQFINDGDVDGGLGLADYAQVEFNYFAQDWDSYGSGTQPNETGEVFGAPRMLWPNKHVYEHRHNYYDLYHRPVTDYIDRVRQGFVGGSFHLSRDKSHFVMSVSRHDILLHAIHEQFYHSSDLYADNGFDADELEKYSFNYAILYDEDTDSVQVEQLTNLLFGGIADDQGVYHPVVNDQDTNWYLPIGLYAEPEGV